jgi:hypothetical protein
MYKKLQASISAVAVLLAATLPLYAAAEDEETTTEAEEALTSADGLYSYGLDEDGNAEIYDFIPSDTYEGELVIPSEIDGYTVDYIGNAAYMNAKGITHITIPASITDLGSSVFFGCTSLEAFTVEEGNTYLSTVDDGVLIADEGGFLLSYPAARTDTTYTVPDSVDEIAPGCFSFSSNLEEVIIPDSVYYIDTWSFAYSGITKVTLPSSLVQVDDYAFAYCSSLHEVDLGGVQSIYNAAFAFCTALLEITIPDTVTYIGQYAFCGTSLQSVTIPSTVTEIDYCAFGYDASMNAIEGFTIYGETGSAAQDYCSAEDEDNEYANDFTFVAVSTDDGDSAEEDGTDFSDASNEQLQEDAADDDNAAKASEAIGTGLKGNTFLQILLGAAGGVAVILAAVLAVLLVKKPKARAETKAEDELEDDKCDTE